MTENDRPVSSSEPAGPGERSDLLDRLIAAGELEPATGGLGETLDSLPPMEPDGIDLAAVLVEMREEERW